VDAPATPSQKFKFPASWREAAIWALVAALLLEFGINLFFRRTIWHRLEYVEGSVKELQHERELEELRVKSQLNELRVKQESNTQVIEKVEEKVEKKK
jgi:preprotein translocase subunit SecF